MRIRIPLKYVELIDSDLTALYATLNLTTELFTEYKQPYKVERLHEKVIYNFCVRQYNINGNCDKYLSMTLNAKMLKNFYFHGLSIRNIKGIYQDIIKFNLFKVKFEDFLDKSFCTDIDFSLDFEQNTCEFTSDIQRLVELTPFSRKRDVGYKEYKSGIEWNSRASGDYTNPYIKLYDKEVEMWSKKSKQKFTEAYISCDELSNRKRIEVTVKGKNELKKHGVKCSSLRTILCTEQCLRKKILKDSLGRVIRIPNRNQSGEGILTTQLSPSELMQMNFLSTLVEDGKDWEEIFNLATVGLSSKSKSFHKAKLWKLFSIITAATIVLPHIINLVIQMFD